MAVYDLAVIIGPIVASLATVAVEQTLLSQVEHHGLSRVTGQRVSPGDDARLVHPFFVSKVQDLDLHTMPFATAGRNAFQIEQLCNFRKR
jgi:hypothetical protein